MALANARDANQIAYRKFKETLAKTYQHGQFIAIADGQIVADAPYMNELRTILEKKGKDPRQVLVVQAGVDHPENGVILSQESAAV